MLLRDDAAEELVVAPLVDPGRYITAPSKPSHFRKLGRRRAVHSFLADVDGRTERLYLKLYRIRTPKDVLEELLRGCRAIRSLEAGLEAERRGIRVPVHLGASTPSRSRLWPRGSTLLMLGLPHRHDVQTRLAEEHPPERFGRARRVFLRRMASFIGDAHRRGLVHTDLKLGNVFVVGADPPAFALIDLDRAHFVAPSSRRGLVAQAFDVRGLLRSMQKRASRRERRLVLAGWLRGRQLDRAARRWFLRLLGVIGAT